MKTVVMSSERADALIEERRRRDIGHLDECWSGVWHLTDPTRRHQEIAGLLYSIHLQVIREAGDDLHQLTDREYDWVENHRSAARSPAWSSHRA